MILFEVGGAVYKFFEILLWQFLYLTKKKILKTLKHIILIYRKTRYKMLLILRSLWILVFCNRHELVSQQVRTHKAKINLEDKGNKTQTTNKTSPKESLTVRDIFSIFDLPNAIHMKQIGRASCRERVC